MYSPTVMDHFGNPRNSGRPVRNNVTGVAGTPEAGPFMVLYLDVEGDYIREVGFQTYGCAPAIAAGSLLTEMIKGRGVEEASAINSKRLMEELGGLPLGKEHCAEIAISALADALRKAGEAGGSRSSA
jgi:nitrogen fixation NifU-like protein